jgi:E1A-binding protein p400
MQADDEDTLEQEEAQQRREGVISVASAQQEIDSLRAEADLPIEELLALYARTSDDDDDDDDRGNGNEDEDEDEDPKENQGILKEALSGDVEKEGLTSELVFRNLAKQGTSAELDEDDDEGRARIHKAAAAATEAQPTGNTLSTTHVKTPVPFLLKHMLREYQHIGLDWLVTMYEKGLNGILADEMGLGKTIQTIALLAHLACEKKNWGPHLVVVPTSVMLNWEREFRKWCPSFKLLTYYGNPKTRRLKRAVPSSPFLQLLALSLSLGCYNHDSTKAYS